MRKNLNAKVNLAFIAAATSISFFIFIFRSHLVPSYFDSDQETFLKIIRGDAIDPDAEPPDSAYLLIAKLFEITKLYLFPQICSFIVFIVTVFAFLLPFILKLLKGKKQQIVEVLNETPVIITFIFVLGIVFTPIFISGLSKEFWIVMWFFFPLILLSRIPFLKSHPEIVLIFAVGLVSLTFRKYYGLIFIIYVVLRLVFLKIKPTIPKLFVTSFFITLLSSIIAFYVNHTDPAVAKFLADYIFKMNTSITPLVETGTILNCIINAASGFVNIFFSISLFILGSPIYILAGIIIIILVFGILNVCRDYMLIDSSKSKIFVSFPQMVAFWTISWLSVSALFEIDYGTFLRHSTPYLVLISLTYFISKLCYNEVVDSKTVLVSGGAGYIGIHTVLELLNSGHTVVVVDNLLNSSEKAIERVKEITSKSLKFYDYDLRDEKMETVFKENKIDVVIHFAGLKAVGESTQKPLEYYDNNVYSSLKLLNLMKKYKVNRLVFSSSATVYNDPNFTEYFEDKTTVTRASSPYGTTKVVQEWIFDDVVKGQEFDEAGGLKVIALRYFNPIGAHESGLIGEDPSGIPNNLSPFITQVAVGRREFLNVWGDDYETPDGTCRRDYIHVVDLAKGHLAAMENLFKNIDSKSSFEAINLGAGEPYSVLEVVKSFSKATGKDIPFKVAPRRNGDLPQFWANVEKAKTILGFKTEKTLDDMTASSWNWQKKNPNGYATNMNDETALEGEKGAPRDSASDKSVSEQSASEDEQSANQRTREQSANQRTREQSANQRTREGAENVAEKATDIACAQKVDHIPDSVRDTAEIPVVKKKDDK